MAPDRGGERSSERSSERGSGAAWSVAAAQHHSGTPNAQAEPEKSTDGATKEEFSRRGTSAASAPDPLPRAAAAASSVRQQIVVDMAAMTSSPYLPTGEHPKRLEKSKLYVGSHLRK